MSSRLNDLPASVYWQRIKDIRHGLNQVGSYQQIGTNNFIPTRIFSGNAYDISFTAPGFTSGSRKFATIRVTFTPSDDTFDNMSLVTRLAPVRIDNNGTILTHFDRYPPNGKTQVWDIYVESMEASGNAIVPIYNVQFKFYLYVLGSGTFTVTQV